MELSAKNRQVPSAEHTRDETPAAGNAQFICAP